MKSKTLLVRRKVTSKRDQVRQLLREIEDLLDDIADADADASWYSPALPTDAVPDRLADLGRHLRQMFGYEEDDEYLADLLSARPGLRDEIARLHDEHGRLLALLEDVCELAGSPTEPGSTWNDVESHYRDFTRELAGHYRDEDALLEHAGAAQVC